MPSVRFCVSPAPRQHAQAWKQPHTFRFLCSDGAASPAMLSPWTSPQPVRELLSPLLAASTKNQPGLAPLPAGDQEVTGRVQTSVLSLPPRTTGHAATLGLGPTATPTWHEEPACLPQQLRRCRGPENDTSLPPTPRSDLRSVSGPGSGAVAPHSSLQQRERQTPHTHGNHPSFVRSSYSLGVHDLGTQSGRAWVILVPHLLGTPWRNFTLG